MQGIVTFLDESNEKQIKSLWELLDLQCDLSGIQKTPYPHFSWQFGDHYELAPIQERLELLCKHVRRFHVLAAGLGIFPGQNPVIYVSLVKTEHLINLHRVLWEEFAPFSMDIFPYYAPNRWMPHITLAYHDVTVDNLGCALREIAFKPFEIEISVNHLALVYQEDHSVGVIRRYDFR